jgi:MFS family permease
MSNFRLLTFISALTFVAIGITAPLLSLYLQSLGADYQQISWVLTSVVAVSLVASYLWGRLSDRLHRRKPILIGGLFILALAFLLLSRAANPAYAWASRLFEGIGTAAYSTLSLAMMGDLLQDDPNRGRRMGWYRGLASAAFAIGSISGGWLADRTSIQQTLLLCATLYLLAGLVALRLQDTPPLTKSNKATPSSSPSSTDSLSPLRRFTQGLPAVFLLGVLLWISGHSASASMWPNYMGSLGYTKTDNGLLWGLTALVEFPAMWFSGALSDKWGRAALLIVGGAGISLTNWGYMTLAGVFPFLIGIQLVRGIGYGSYTSNAMTFAAESGDPAQRGSRSGLFNATMSAGQLLGSLLGGTLVQHFDFRTLYAVCATLAFCAALSFYGLHRRSRE